MLLVNRESHNTHCGKRLFLVHKLHFAVEFSIEARVMGRCRSSQKPDKFSKNTVFGYLVIWLFGKY